VKINSVPKSDKFFMPAEYSPHSGTIMIFPERTGSWIYDAKHVRPIFASLIKVIASGEKVYLGVSKSALDSAKKLLSAEIESGSVVLWNVETDDCWARDMSPTFVVDGKNVRAIDWQFNAWGGDFDGLYTSWEKDDKFALFSAEKLGVDYYSARPFVLEGGSIHSNGKGTIITTEECLLSKGRNPHLTKAEIEKKLKDYLGADRVIWLPYGICGDETNGHVDNICAFTSENEVVLSWTDEDGEQKRRCQKDLEVLESAGIKVTKLPLPKKQVQFSEYELKGFVYEEGEIERSLSDNLAASYANFYVCNAGVCVPVFGDENDTKAVTILRKAFSGREVIPIFAREFIYGGGNIHCLTQQIPCGEVKK
jgi:agmatine deiminase